MFLVIDNSRVLFTLNNPPAILPEGIHVVEVPTGGPSPDYWVVNDGVASVDVDAYRAKVIGETFDLVSEFRKRFGYSLFGDLELFQERYEQAVDLLSGSETSENLPLLKHDTKTPEEIAQDVIEQRKLWLKVLVVTDKWKRETLAELSQLTTFEAMERAIQTLNTKSQQWLEMNK